MDHLGKDTVERIQTLTEWVGVWLKILLLSEFKKLKIHLQIALFLSGNYLQTIERMSIYMVLSCMDWTVKGTFPLNSSCSP